MRTHRITKRAICFVLPTTVVQLQPVKVIINPRHRWLCNVTTIINRFKYSVYYFVDMLILIDTLISCDFKFYLDLCFRYVHFKSSPVLCLLKCLILVYYSHYLFETFFIEYNSLPIMLFFSSKCVVCISEWLTFLGILTLRRLVPVESFHHTLDHYRSHSENLECCNHIHPSQQNTPQGQA